MTVARTLAEEIEGLKYYIRACPYNCRLAMFLDYIFNIQSQSNIPIHQRTIRYIDISAIVLSFEDE